MKSIGFSMMVAILLLPAPRAAACSKGEVRGSCLVYLDTNRTVAWSSARTGLFAAGGVQCPDIGERVAPNFTSGGATCPRGYESVVTFQNQMNSQPSPVVTGGNFVYAITFGCACRNPAEAQPLVTGGGPLPPEGEVPLPFAPPEGYAYDPEAQPFEGATATLTPGQQTGGGGGGAPARR